MTPKQIERLKKKITDIRRRLASEKRKFGCYDDSRGMRYLPTKYYIELGDYSGGLTYTRWFDKNFPDDSGFPEFLFEWTLILFKNGKKKDAEKKAIQTFFSNTYIFDKFLGNPFLKFDKYEGSNWERASMTKHFDYTKIHPSFIDFAEWLTQFLSSSKFYTIANEFIEIQCRLKTEPNEKIRSALILRERALLDGYK